MRCATLVLWERSLDINGFGDHSWNLVSDDGRAFSMGHLVDKGAVIDSPDLI